MRKRLLVLLCHQQTIYFNLKLNHAMFSLSSLLLYSVVDILRKCFNSKPLIKHKCLVFRESFINDVTNFYSYKVHSRNQLSPGVISLGFFNSLTIEIDFALIRNTLQIKQLQITTFKRIEMVKNWSCLQIGGMQSC